MRVPGQYYDQETGLHYNYFRDYDPVTGRYIESDPIGLRGGLNTYAYVGSNPLLYIDRLGLKGGCPANMYPGPGNICIPNPDDNYKKECVTAECAAGLPPVPTRDEVDRCRAKCFLEYANPVPDAVTETGADQLGKKTIGDTAGLVVKDVVKKFNKAKGAYDLGSCLLKCKKKNACGN